MAKRMFSSVIVESDAFLDMPLTAQALYMHLNMNADNDGFVNPKRIVRMTGAANDDLQILIAKRFLLVFDSGIIVIKHWWINNTKRHDRHVPTTYQTELSELDVKDNKSYTIKSLKLELETEVGNQVATRRQPLGASMQYNAIHVQSNTIHSAKKSPVKKITTKKSILTAEENEIGVLYYEVIKTFKLPVTNHNTIKAKIKAMAKEDDHDKIIKYLEFMRDQYESLDFDFKPQISTALDIYTKRLQIRNVITQQMREKVATAPRSFGRKS